MNTAQRKVLFGVIAAIIVAFLFPPHAVFRDGGGALRMGWSFIGNIPEVHSVHVTMLLTEWFGIGVIAAIMIYLLRD